MSNLRPTGCMWPRLAMNAAQHKIVNLLKTFFFAHQFSLVFVYLMCGWRQLFFFQCGPEMPKDRAPLLDNYNTIVFVSCVALRCYKAKTSLGNRNFSDPLQSHGPTFVKEVAIVRVLGRGGWPFSRNSYQCRRQGTSICTTTLLFWALLFLITFDNWPPPHPIFFCVASAILASTQFSWVSSVYTGVYVLLNFGLFSSCWPVFYYGDVSDKNPEG